MRISDWSSDVCSSDLIRTEFFTAQGLDDSVFPASAYIGPDALVEAALAGLASGEKVTVPTLVDAGSWDRSAERRVGKECVRTGRSRRSTGLSKKTITKHRQH